MFCGHPIKGGIDPTLSVGLGVKTDGATLAPMTSGGLGLQRLEAGSLFPASD